MNFIAIIIGVLVLIAIYFVAAPMSVFTVGGIILTIIAVAIGFPAAFVLFKLITNSK